MRQITHAPERFWPKVQKTPTCWLWTAAKDRDGYGVFHPAADDRVQGAHRFAYELERGPVPSGLQIDHLCRVRDCVNPAHLEAVTIKENQLRRYRAPGALKTHCARGHEFTEDNTLRRARGTRACRTCDRNKPSRRRGKLLPGTDQTPVLGSSSVDK